MTNAIKTIAADIAINSAATAREARIAEVSSNCGLDSDYLGKAVANAVRELESIGAYDMPARDRLIAQAAFGGPSALKSFCKSLDITDESKSQAQRRAEEEANGAMARAAIRGWSKAEQRRCYVDAFKASF